MQKILPFDEKNIPHIVDVVQPLWTVPEMPEDFARIYAECIVRANFVQNEFALQIEDDGVFKSVVFAERKNDKSALDEWIKKIATERSLDQEKIDRLGSCKKYISFMDEKTFSFMNADDVKLSLFVSAQKGCGGPLLAEARRRFKAAGFKNLYLWTDCDCTWEYYPDHGYTLVEEGTYDEFSRPDDPYRTFIYKKEL